MDIVDFAKTFLNIELHDYQKRWLRDMSQKKTIRMGRQSGKSTMAVVEALNDVITTISSSPYHSIGVLSPSQRIASLNQAIMTHMINKHDHLKAQVKHFGRDVIVFVDGSRIKFTSNVHLFAGFNLDKLIVDEASYLSDRDFGLALLGLKINGKIRLLGTPAGDFGFFYDSFKGDLYSKHWVSFTESAIVSKSALELAMRVMNDMSPERFASDFMALFPDEIGGPSDDNNLLRIREHMSWARGVYGDLHDEETD